MGSKGQNKNFEQSDGKINEASEQVNRAVPVTFLNNHSSCWVETAYAETGGELEE